MLLPPFHPDDTAQIALGQSPQLVMPQQPLADKQKCCPERVHKLCAEDVSFGTADSSCCGASDNQAIKTTYCSCQYLAF